MRVKEILNTLFDSVMESLFLNIEIHKYNLCVGEMYQVPNTDLKIFEHHCEDLLKFFSNFKNVMMGSDHKLDLLKSNIHGPTEKFVNDLAFEVLVHTITKPTRVTFDTSMVIDNIFCKGQMVFNYNSYILLDDMSDHYPCVVRINSFAMPKKDYMICKCKFNDKVYLKLNRYLLFHDWTPIHDLDANESYMYLVSVIKKYLDEVAPAIEILISHKEHFVEPWMSVKLSKYSTKCKRLFKQARNSCNQNLYKKYKRY